MSFEGICIGFMTFFIIGIFHPIVIKAEYYFGKRVWPVFLAIGIASLILSVFLTNFIASACVGVFGFSSLWSIHELIEQEERVKRGWFPENPNRKQTDTTYKEG